MYSPDQRRYLFIVTIIGSIVCTKLYLQYKNIIICENGTIAEKINIQVKAMRYKSFLFYSALLQKKWTNPLPTLSRFIIKNNEMCMAV